MNGWIKVSESAVRVIIMWCDVCYEWLAGAVGCVSSDFPLVTVIILWCRVSRTIDHWCGVR